MSARAERETPRRRRRRRRNGDPGGFRGVYLLPQLLYHGEPSFFGFFSIVHASLGHFDQGRPGDRAGGGLRCPGRAGGAAGAHHQPLRDPGVRLHRGHGFLRRGARVAGVQRPGTCISNWAVPDWVMAFTCSRPARRCVWRVSTCRPAATRTASRDFPSPAAAGMVASTQLGTLCGLVRGGRAVAFSAPARLRSPLGAGGAGPVLMVSSDPLPQRPRRPDVKHPFVLEHCLDADRECCGPDASRGGVSAERHDLSSLRDLLRRLHGCPAHAGVGLAPRLPSARCRRLEHRRAGVEENTMSEQA